MAPWSNVVIGFEKQGIPKAGSRSTDVGYEYVGQSYELIIPYSEHFIDTFHAAHLKEYSYQRLDAAFEIVNVRVQAIGLGDPPPLPLLPLAGPDPSTAYLYDSTVIFPRNAAIPFSGEKLLRGQIQGQRLCSG
jgi:N-methylhydantoinase A